MNPVFIWPHAVPPHGCAPGECFGAPIPVIIPARGTLPRPHCVSADSFRIRHTSCTVAGRGGASVHGTVHSPLETGPPSVHQSHDRAGSALRVGIKWIKAERARPSGVRYARSSDLGYRRPRAPGCSHVNKRVLRRYARSLAVPGNLMIVRTESHCPNPLPAERR